MANANANSRFWPSHEQAWQATEDGSRISEIEVTLQRILAHLCSRCLYYMKLYNSHRSIFVIHYVYFLLFFCLLFLVYRSSIRYKWIKASASIWKTSKTKEATQKPISIGRLEQDFWCSAQKMVSHMSTAAAKPFDDGAHRKHGYGCRCPTAVCADCKGHRTTRTCPYCHVGDAPAPYTPALAIDTITSFIGRRPVHIHPRRPSACHYDYQLHNLIRKSWSEKKYSTVIGMNISILLWAKNDAMRAFVSFSHLSKISRRSFSWPPILTLSPWTTDWRLAAQSYPRTLADEFIP